MCGADGYTGRRPKLTFGTSLRPLALNPRHDVGKIASAQLLQLEYALRANRHTPAASGAQGSIHLDNWGLILSQGAKSDLPLESIKLLAHVT